MKQTEVNNHKELIQDPQFEMDLRTLYIKVKGETIGLADTNNNPDIFTVTSIQSNRLSCNASTIHSENKSVTSCEIPMTVSVKNNNLPWNLHHQYVTNRRPKKKIPIVDTEQIIKSAAKFNITRLRKGRRSSGFSRPVSPLDSNYNKTSN